MISFKKKYFSISMFRYLVWVQINKPLSPVDEVSDSMVVFEDERYWSSFGTDITFYINLFVRGISLDGDRIFFSHGYNFIPYNPMRLSGSGTKIFLKNSSNIA